MPSSRSHVRTLRHWLANRGVRGVLREVRYRLRLKMSGEAVPGRENDTAAQHPFDAEYGTETTGLVWAEHMQVAPDKPLQYARYWATGYYGISPSTFTAALQQLDLPWKDFTFVDVGCGKGRALLLALRFPFRRVLGIELSPELAAAAGRNLVTFAAPWRCEQVSAEAVVADATSFAVPSGPLLLFLYHPFAAPVMKLFLEHLRAAAAHETRPILLLYANPELAPLLETTRGIQPLWRYSFEMSAEDTGADRFSSTGENFAAYRLE